MELSSINFSQNITSKTNKTSNNTNTASNISFKCNSCNDKNTPSGEQCSIYFHPVFELQKQLLEDGYSIEEIRKHQIFDVIEVKDVDLSDPNLLDDALEGKITKNDIFSYTPKKLADVRAIQKAYTLLKHKFDTPDVQEHIASMRKIEESLERFFQSKGIDRGNSHRTTLQSMILDVLHYVDKDNVNLLEALLDDENFDNVHLTKALMKINKNKDMSYAMATLKMAQEIGYDKEFSEALAIIISEAQRANMPIIEKMLEEQTFLAENEGFVCNKMMSFLRGSDIDLAYSYIANDDITLKEIDELMEYND